MLIQEMAIELTEKLVMSNTKDDTRTQVIKNRRNKWQDYCKHAKILKTSLPYKQSSLTKQAMYQENETKNSRLQRRNFSTQQRKEAQDTHTKDKMRCGRMLKELKNLTQKEKR
jgi:hypothetical protein